MILGKNIHNAKNNISGDKVGLELNNGKSEYIFMSPE